MLVDSLARSMCFAYILINTNARLFGDIFSRAKEIIIRVWCRTTIYNNI